MKKNLHIWLLSALLLIVATAALMLVFKPQSGGDKKSSGGVPAAVSTPTASEKPPRDNSIVKWRTPISSQVECLAANSHGWVVGERSGRITALAGSKIGWRITFKDQNWQAIAQFNDKLVAVSFQGMVCMLNSEDGSTRWMRETDGTFMHAPLFRSVEDTWVMWLISQGDSTIYCLRVADGEVLWKSEPSNRCDGRPSFWWNRLVFGNCDGVVYVVDEKTGKSLGIIETGGQSDPIAGTMCTLDTGLMLTGTYLGNFLLLDVHGMTLLDKVKIADSEAFATPVRIGATTVAMGTPDGRITLWETRERKLQSIGEIKIGNDGVDEMMHYDDNLWVLAGRTFCKVNLKSQQVQTFNIGDNMKGLALNWSGKLALLADGDVVCLGRGDYVLPR